jgi:hypothetical protein
LKNTHVIGKQTFLIGVPRPQDAHVWQQAVSQAWWQYMAPALEKLFDRLAGPETIIRLDKLEIDLGPLDPQMLNQEAIGKLVAEQCEKALLTVLKDVHHAGSRQLPAQLNQFDRWLYWLQHGHLTWHGATPDSDWFRSILDTIGLDAAAVTRFRQTLSRHPQAIKRLVWQHPEYFLQAIMELHTGRNETRFVEIIHQMRRAMQQLTPAISADAIRQWELASWRAAIQAVVVQGQSWEERLFVTAFTASVPKPQDTLDALKAFTASNPSDFQALRTLVENKSLWDKTQAAPATSKADQQQYPEPNTPSEEAIFIQNAGVVLLHPFLSSLFNNLGLLEGNAFKNEAAQNKAILLLHGAATGETQAPEYALVLPKILCNCPVNQPLDYTMTLSEPEMEELDQLLRAAIGHWGALGSTSPDGLREGFLQRDGKLVFEQGNLRLHVEQKTLDLLLNRLPWNISLIKLPWMPDMLQVNWI